ncbi:MAG: hypothetical protein HOA76_04100 [Gammaproteobacteria bacterium]|nr:hypothetical protein [Gammaproteobacteria bacterium]MBT6734471.1 hypothetical protein [Gammaproteobacteria bacterium]
MKKILGLIVIILLFAYIPIYSIWPIDYSSKTTNILIFLVNAQVIIIESLSSLISLLMPILLGLVDTIAGLLFQVIGAILSLPYGDINPAYVLIGLFITAYFFEKFRVINNEISKLNKKLLKHITSNQNDSKKPLSDHMDEIYKLNNKANSIMSLLLEINNATNIFKSIGLRSKKMRRESAPESSTNHNEEVVSFSDLDKSNDISQAVRDEKRAKDEEQLMRLRKDAKSLAEEDKDSDEVNTVDEIMDDDNISQIDLARALIASNDVDNARDLLKRIVETGSEDDKHEARLLFMQIK